MKEPSSPPKPKYGGNATFRTHLPPLRSMSSSLSSGVYGPRAQALRLSFSENESFLFCGYKLLHFQLPPGFSHAVTFNLVPVRT